ncbi:PH, RCC1 and FYVE domains-containing protein 1 [Heracleum sosnowskyi]|uniref:PH, RCC1 and FYVE domains-containing protein 1 n=1 Tax=Heracleum sosnowskyi TaxID=360622 RepID=A0AAD8IG61_9APIA|nr:PH, RCC1 and FYVE domains-containing protein 1 [Heracleum sosnowskyi]
MGEESLALNPSERTIEQAIVTLKKGAQLLKCGRRGKPKFCPFRLSTDEKLLIWYSGQEERQLRLSSVTNVIRGQKNKPFQSERECQSISLLIANSEHSLDLICKDKTQADSWFLGLRAVISRSNRPRFFRTSESGRSAQSCVNSPAGYMRRKHNLGLSEDTTTRISQVRSLAGSPPQSFSEKCIPDGLSCSSNSFYSESSLSSMQNIMDTLTPNSPYIAPDDLNKRGKISASMETQISMLDRFMTPANESRNDILRDIFFWGEGLESGTLGGVIDKFGGNSDMIMDALLPKLLESTTMLDVQKISVGGKHAALVTKQGEVFCWGDGRGGRLGHKVNMDISCPKVVESLAGIQVTSVICGENQTCAVTLSGDLYAWGDNFHGTEISVANRIRNNWFPRRISGILDGLIVSNVSCGDWHTAILSTSGQLFTYGDGTFGVLGHGTTQSISEPKEVESLKGLRVKSVSCGAWHTAAIVDIMVDHLKSDDPAGKLFTWGDADKGRLGHPDQEMKLVPTCVAQLVDYDFIQVCCGRMVTVGLTNVGTVYTMGSSVHGQLGNPQAADKSVTVVQGKLKHEFVRAISAGSFHIAALTSRGKVYTWGKGTNGQLGLGGTEDKSSPALVEALRDRQVESVACGSSSTAVICLHKFISSTDQSACRGCSMAFGFTRKKHNCYNCGLLFCRACSSKKSLHASLASDKSRMSRVCDQCFNRLQRTENPNKLDAISPQPVLVKQKGFLTERSNPEDVVAPSRTFHSNDSQCGDIKTIKDKGEFEHPRDANSPLSGVLPRWGQVPSPVYFGWKYREQKNSLSPATEDLLTCNVATVEGGSNSNHIHAKEVEDLRAQVEVLEKLCHTRQQKIEEYQSKIEATWSLAKEEAAKSKAAKELIIALTSRLHVMSEKLCAGKELKDQSCANLSQIIPICTDTPTLKDVHPMFVVTNAPTANGRLEDRTVDSACNTPLLFSSKIRAMSNRESNSSDSRSAEESCGRRSDSKQNEIKPKVDWVEQYQPGVYITFTTLPSGQKGLKRVRFSRRKFTDKEAARLLHGCDQNSKPLIPPIQTLRRGI